MNYAALVHKLRYPFGPAFAAGGGNCGTGAGGFKPDNHCQKGGAGGTTGGVSRPPGAGRKSPPGGKPDATGGKGHPITVVSDGKEFPSAPVEMVTREGLGHDVEVLPNGHVRYLRPGWGATTGQQRDRIRGAVADHFKAKVLAAHEAKFGPGHWRATNNKDEPELMKAGELRASTNHADHTAEKGLSVTDGLHYGAIAGYKYVYRVHGPPAGTGSDGEPLVDPSRAKPTTKLYGGASKSKLMDWDRSLLQQSLAEHGWTPDQYLAMTSGPDPLPSEEFHKHPQVKRSSNHAAPPPTRSTK